MNKNKQNEMNQNKAQKNRMMQNITLNQSNSNGITSNILNSGQMSDFCKICRRKTTNIFTHIRYFHPEQYIENQIEQDS